MECRQVRTCLYNRINEHFIYMYAYVSMHLDPYGLVQLYLGLLCAIYEHFTLGLATRNLGVAKDRSTMDGITIYLFDPYFK